MYLPSILELEMRYMTSAKQDPFYSKKRSTNDKEERKISTNQWWKEVQHRGLFISEPVLNDLFPDGPSPVSVHVLHALLQKLSLFKNLDHSNKASSRIRNKRLMQWIQSVLKNIVIPSGSNWYDVGIDLNSEDDTVYWKTVGLKEREVYDEKLNCYLLTNKTQGRKIILNQTELLLYIDKTGKGRGAKKRAKQSDFAQFLRSQNISIGIFTNGYDFILIYAGADRDAWMVWDAEAWFEFTELSEQMCSSFFNLVSARENRIDLLEIVERSQQRQAELSTTLGEQVRDAIEIFLEGHTGNVISSQILIESVLGEPWDGKTLPPSKLNPIYQAAIRIINRLIIIFFAEARQLFPVNDSLYHNSYSLDQLFINLKEAEKEVENELDSQFHSWRRVQGLFSLVYSGIHCEDLNFPAYGGELFQPGDSKSNDVILRVISVFESENWEISDLELLQILGKLKETKLSSGELKGTKVLVDFLKLDTEYIGMIYEGVLDYQLRCVSKDDKEMVVIEKNREKCFISAIQIEKYQDDQKLHKRIKKTLDLKEKKKKKSLQISEDTHRLPQNIKRTIKQRINQILQPYMPIKIDTYPVGRLYIAKWDGLRKGSGSFYTRPGLTIPIIERSLDSLIYQNGEKKKGLITPEDILKLKIIDPAMGSGSFLIGCIRYLTQKMYESLNKHGRIRRKGNEILIILTQEDSGTKEEVIIIPDDGTLDGKNNILTHIRPSIVNSCIYGVDSNPHAVELAKIGIWMTILDKHQPLKFLNHKLKVGNSLVGIWLAQLYDYPIKSFRRKIEKHDKPVHFKNYNKRVNSVIRQEKKLAEEILKSVNIRLKSGQKKIDETDNEDLLSISQRYNSLTENLRSLKIGSLEAEDNLRVNYSEIIEMPIYKKLKLACDWWISLWFLSIIDEDIENSRNKEDFKKSLKSPTHLLHLNDLREKLREKSKENNENGRDDLERINEVVQTIRPFHWELEFPDVFLHQNPGFDLVIGNPPWKPYKAISGDFFTKYDNIFESLGKQEKLSMQRELYRSDPRIEEEWLKYSEHFSFFKNYKKENVDQPSNKNRRLNLNVKGESVILRSPAFFENQYKADTNLYKLFLERFYHLTKNKGKVGIILPSGIYADEGSQDLRKMLFDLNKWKLLFSFRNRLGIFPIGSNIRFAVCIFEKGGKTKKIATAFLRENISDLNSKFEESNYVFFQSKLDIQAFSPEYLRFLEITNKRDLEILRKLREKNVLVESDYKGEWEVKYKREFDATGDSDKFIEAASLHKLAEKFSSTKILNTYGIIKNIKTSEIYLPILKGKDITIGKVRFKEHTNNRQSLQSHSWFLPPNLKCYYMKYEDAHRRTGKKDLKIAFRNNARSSDSRSMITAIVPNYPTVNSLPVVNQQFLNEETLLIGMFLQSFVYDYYLRKCISGANVNLFIFKRTILPPLANVKCKEKILPLAANLNLNAPIFCTFWKKHASMLGVPIKYWALTEHEQLRLQVILNAVSAYCYSMSLEDFSYILRSDQDNVTGFFKVGKKKKEKDVPPHVYIKAYKDLKEQGISTFLSSEYQLPQEIGRLLGPRFLDWQIDMTEQDAWNKCESYVTEFDAIFK